MRKRGEKGDLLVRVGGDLRASQTRPRMNSHFWGKNRGERRSGKNLRSVVRGQKWKATARKKRYNKKGRKDLDVNSWKIFNGWPD